MQLTKVLFDTDDGQASDDATPLPTGPAAGVAAMVAEPTLAPAIGARLCACGCGAAVRSREGTFAPGHHMYVIARPRASCRECGEPARLYGQTLRRASTYNPGTHTYICRICQKGALATCRVRTQRAVLYGVALRTAETYDPATHTYICRRCKTATTRVTATCQRCPRTKSFGPCQFERLKSAKYTERGATYLCKPCRDRDHGKRKLLPGALAKQGIGPDASPEEQREALTRILKAGIKSFKGGRPAVEKMRVAGVRRGRSEEGRRGRSEEGRRKHSIGKLIYRATHKSGEYGLCAHCGLLSYVRQYRLKAGALHIHGQCYNEFQRTAEYRTWRKGLGGTRLPDFRTRIRLSPYPSPRPGRGRRPSSDELGRWLSWLLMKTLARMSWAEIAKAAAAADPTAPPPTRSTIEHGVARLIELLPESWGMVYHGQPVGRLNELLPVHQVKEWFYKTRRGNKSGVA